MAAVAPLVESIDAAFREGFAAACVVAYESREHKLEEVCAFVTDAGTQRMSCWHDRSSESSSCCFVF
jgi:hypothetical protein